MSFEIVFYCDNCQKVIGKSKNIIALPARKNDTRRKHVTHFCTPDCKREYLDDLEERKSDG